MEALQVPPSHPDGLGVPPARSNGNCASFAFKCLFKTISRVVEYETAPANWEMRGRGCFELLVKSPSTFNGSFC